MANQERIEPLDLGKIKELDYLSLVRHMRGELTEISFAMGHYKYEIFVFFISSLWILRTSSFTVTAALPSVIT